MCRFLEKAVLPLDVIAPHVKTEGTACLYQDHGIWLASCFGVISSCILWLCLTTSFLHVTTAPTQLRGPAFFAIQTWRSFRRATCSRRYQLDKHGSNLRCCFAQTNILSWSSSQISMKREAHLKKYPDAKVISLGIGDTTEPIPSVITSAMAEVFFVLYLKVELFFPLSFFYGHAGMRDLKQYKATCGVLHCQTNYILGCKYIANYCSDTSIWWFPELANG